jgi:3'(2'), 5'-bisphosphate nucleotidase
MTLARELEAALAIAGEAATLVRGFLGRPLVVDRKAGDEPVTAADRAASELIVDRLRAAFPTDAVLSEEVPDDGARLHNRRVWMVDPIDGTRDFIGIAAGTPAAETGSEPEPDVVAPVRALSGFAVMIGLCVDGRPVVGAVALPLEDVIYAGIPGQGAWRYHPDGRREPLGTTSRAAPPGIRLVASKSHRTREVDEFRRALAIEDEVNIGSVGVKVAMVADGRRDLYVYPGGRTKVWDSCAPEAVLLGAGGRMTDITGAPLAYTDADLYNRRGIIASNGPLHDLVLGTVRGLRAAGNMP